MSTQDAYAAELAGLQAALAANVRKLRREKLPELSQEAVASHAALHRTQWGSVEQGKRDPGFSTLLVIAEALGVTLNDLAEGIDAPKERRPAPTAKAQRDHAGAGRRSG
jgi:transcriptional regulator with XRE-family HTH domain